jgi:hypothetical protein
MPVIQKDLQKTGQNFMNAKKSSMETVGQKPPNA